MRATAKASVGVKVECILASVEYRELKYHVIFRRIEECFADLLAHNNIGS
jgi:hypothetical protein